MATQPNNHNHNSPWSRGIRGMQVHAVPDSDKAFDQQGRKLPWAYSLDPNAASSTPNHSEPVEKGPFGRSQRRSRSTLSRSRSKTAEPKREEDRLKAEQQQAEDAVFGSLRRKDRDALGEIDGNAVAGAQQGQPAVGGGLSGKDGAKGEIEATEVMLYGFGEELQWAALDHYERVSGGIVLEDYERQSAGQWYDVARSLSRATNQRSLTRAALRKKNTFAGGLHWIKITFDSRGAAELACARSPHIIKGHLVYAEPYLGRGPGRDEPIMASQAGAQITDSVLPTSFSTNTLNPIEGSPNSSTTATSATATTSRHPQHLPHSQSTPTLTSISPSSSTTVQHQHQAAQSLATPHTPATIRRRRISGVTPAQILPLEAALMPKPPKASWGSWIGAGEVIGSTVPKKEDGSFDYDAAGVYWRVWWWVDRVLGTDWLGMRAD